MSPTPEAEASPRLDVAKWAAAGLIAAAAIGAYHYFSEQLLIVRVLGLLAAAAVAVGIAASTRQGGSVLGYLRDSRTELRKVVWPTRQETLQTTLAVVLMVAVMGLFMWLLDLLLLWGVRTLTGQGA